MVLLYAVLKTWVMMDKYYTVQEDDQNIRIDKFIRRELKIPQSLVEKFLRKGIILLDNMKVKSDTRINVGSVIYIKYNGVICEKKHSKKVSESDSDFLVNLIRNDILYKDDDVLVINKPTGISVQGGTKVKVSISDIVDKIIDGESMKIVHRLDKDTSGVLILARNARVSRLIMQEFKNRRVRKKYLALTQGIPENDIGQINHSIIKSKHTLPLEKIDNSCLQEAITSFSVLKKLPYDVGLLELKPITGRKHQIRIHLSQIGCSIIGDKKYGKFCKHVLNDHLQLHAYSLSINIGTKELTFTAPIPSYMEDTIMYLEKLL
ncbi:RluA family pseudouridine synthase [Ehrlichia muris]|nr:RluA family pseudouridine synthase [Ehrlichia muris]